MPDLLDLSPTMQTYYFLWAYTSPGFDSYQKRLVNVSISIALSRMERIKQNERTSAPFNIF